MADSSCALAKKHARGSHYRADSALDPDELSLVKLHGVEANGIWIESQDFTDGMMKKLKLTSQLPRWAVRSVPEH